VSEALMGNPLYDKPTVLKSEFDSEKRKWEFRYNNQDKRLKELEATVKRQTTKIRKLKAERDKLADESLGDWRRWVF